MRHSSKSHASGREEYIAFSSKIEGMAQRDAVHGGSAVSKVQIDGEETTKAERSFVGDGHLRGVGTGAG